MVKPNFRYGNWGSSWTQQKQDLTNPPARTNNLQFLWFCLCRNPVLLILTGMIFNPSLRKSHCARAVSLTPELGTLTLLFWATPRSRQEAPTTSAVSSLISPWVALGICFLEPPGFWLALQKIFWSSSQRASWAQTPICSKPQKLQAKFSLSNWGNHCGALHWPPFGTLWGAGQSSFPIISSV